jgi:hypothetical protein
MWCVSWDWPGPVTTGVSIHCVMRMLWGCVSWDWPGPVTPITMTGTRGKCATSYQIVTVLPALLALINLGILPVGNLRGVRVRAGCRHRETCFTRAHPLTCIEIRIGRGFPAQSQAMG